MAANVLRFYLLLVFLSTVELSKNCTYTYDAKNKGVNVDCSRGGLSTVPDDLPLNTTSLYLNNNKIKHLLHNQFVKLTNLKYLNLNLNPISDIHEKAFNNLFQLQELQLNGHDLNYSVKSLPDKVFKPLTSLRRLSIRSTFKYTSNKHHFISQGKILGYLVSLQSLRIDAWIVDNFNWGFSKLHNLQELDLSATFIDGISFTCQLPYITNTTFIVFKSIPISTINLYVCVLHYIDRDSFAPLTSLENMVLSTSRTYSNVAIPQLIATLHVFKNRSLKSVQIINSKPHFWYLQAPGYPLSLEILSDICIEELVLSYNQINMVDFSILLTFPIPPLTKCLKHLDLSRNAITGKIAHPVDAYLLLPLFVNLEYVDLSRQSKFQMDGNMRIRGALPVGGNSTIPIYLPEKLRYLYMDGMADRIGMLPICNFTGGSNLISLNLSYTGLTFSPKSKVFGLEKIQILDFSYCDCLFIEQSFFDTFPNLTTLRLSSVNLDHDVFFNIGKRLFQPLKKLQNLDLTDNLLSILPVDIFNGLTKLKEISLSFNNLVSIPDLSTLVNLHNIYLSYNALATVDEQTRSTLDKLNSEKNPIRVSLFGNTFGCTCDSSSLLAWFYQTRVDLDGRNYSCIDKMGEKTTTRLVTNHYRALQLHCVSSTWLTVAVTGTSLLLVALLTMFVFVKNKLRIKLILLRMVGRYIKPRRREEFLYDVCILYADDVYQWVCHDLCVELGDRRGLKLFIRDRDEIPGEDKPVELYNTMDSSWRVLLILTPGFLVSEFASTTMSMCLSFITMTTPNRLMLIMDSNMNIPTNIDFFLESVNEENIYRYGINNRGADDPRFWNNIYHGITAANNRIHNQQH
ncbi:toll-like receptor 4 [Patella vulgata]|uniref:toll-like receptor 4 n=1 Tax=Patella vulgata TaxID=6465 RepID=UPI00217FDAB3|nr:toll-like receptor 4 [Patella vulgata]